MPRYKPESGYPDPNELTVYSSVSKDGTIRWALHEMDKNPNYARSAPSKPQWNFRVIYCRGVNGRKREINQSCRGADWYSSTSFSARSLEYYERYVENFPEECNDHILLRWLYEGEEGKVDESDGEG